MKSKFSPLKLLCMHKNIFYVSFASSLLLMGSGLFLGTISIDDELHLTSSYFGGIGRGMWLSELVTHLLPGQLGISFAPMLLGCALYAVSTTILISLWGLPDRTIGNICAAIIGCFPYFASMMTFDVVQIAYPIGFILIISSIVPVFRESASFFQLAVGALCFALAFSCYQGVAASFTIAFSATAGIRFLLGQSKDAEFARFWRRYFPRGLCVALLGGIIYLGIDKLVLRLFPHQEWGDDYKVKLALNFLENNRFDSIVNNIASLLLGKSGDLPQVSSILFLLASFAIALGILLLRDFAFWKKVVTLLAFAASVFILPFWLIFVQSNLLAPRSMVGLGILYGCVYSILATISIGRWKMLINTIAGIWCFQFIFLGNEMYYSQHLVNTAEQATIHRIVARIDALASRNRLPYPLPVTMVGRYAPGGQTFTKFSTLGHSPMNWDAGNIHRQALVFRNMGIDGIKINASPELRSELEKFVQAQGIPKWPHPDSVFIFQNKVVAVNFGGLRKLEKAYAQSSKPQIDTIQTKILYDLLKNQKIGSKFEIEFKPGGIFMHPGGQTTEAVFDIANQFQNIFLVGYILKLPDKGLAEPLAGTVGMEVFVDGKTQGRRLVDRHTNQTYQLDLASAKELKVVVDCANGTANWDHFCLGIEMDSPNP
jgi:hypothetical protein